MERLSQTGLLILLVLGPWPARAQSLDTDMWVTNGPVKTINKHNDTIFVGGKFSYVGPYTGYAVMYESASDSLLNNFPKIDGVVYDIIPDGFGGWYVAGNFTRVGNSQINHLVRLNADLTVNGLFRPNPGGPVYTICRVNDDWLCVGGDFNTMGPEERLNIAPLDPFTGGILTDDTEWLIGIHGPVYDIHLDETPKSYIHAQNMHTYAVPGTYQVCMTIMSDPSPLGPACYDVYCDSIIVGDTSACVAGFTQEESPNNNSRFFKMDTLAPWDRFVWDFGDGSIDSTSVTLHHSFPDGAYLTCVTVYNDSTGCQDTWCDSVYIDVEGYCFANFKYKPGLGNQVYFIPNSLNLDYNRTIMWDYGDGTVDTSNVIAIPKEHFLYVGGDFQFVNQEERPNLVKLTLGGWPWPAKAPGLTVDGVVKTINSTDRHIYFGGDFAFVNNEARPFLAEIDKKMMDVSSWQPLTNGTVNDIVIGNNQVFIGGYFTEVNGEPRNYLASLDTSHLWSLTQWKPDANDGVYSLLFKNNW